MSSAQPAARCAAGHVEDLGVGVAAGAELAVAGHRGRLRDAAATARPLTRRGNGRSVSLATAMTREGTLRASRTADTEVFYIGLGLAFAFFSHSWISQL